VSWKNVALGELCEVLDSKRKPITKKDRTTGSYPYYGATGIVDYVGDFIFNEKLVLIGEDGAKWDSGDMTAFIADGEYWVNNHAHVIKPLRNRLLDEWLVYYFYYKDLKEFVTGLTVPKLNQGQLKTIPIPLPPLATQQKIVAKLDAIFFQIDTAKAAAEANADNAEALFLSYLNEVFERGGKDWTTSELGKITKFIDYRGKTPAKTSSGVRLITAKNVKFGFVNKEPCEYIAEDAYDKWMTRGIPIKGDVLFTTEAPLANVAQLDTDERVVFAQRLIILQPKNNEIDSEFLKFSLLSRKVQNDIISKGTGATVSGIKASLLKLILIEFPSIAKQKEICKRLSTVYLESIRLKKYYEYKIVNLNAYRNSILQRAFSGELVKD
jgi:type I restriction enzyme S subunit